MPEGWSKPRDFARLADLRARFEFEIGLDELPGIPAEFRRADGPVRAELHFGRERGTAVVDVKARVALTPRCQRCMREMRLNIASESRVALVESEAQADGVPAGFETFLAADGHATLAALVAEELLLALPIVPRHEAGAEACDAPAAAGPSPGAMPGPAGAAAAGETQRPFAQLRAMLGRGGN